LFATACLSACFLVGWLVWPHLRGGAVLSATVLSPFAVLGTVFVPAYWQPDHRFTVLRGVGIEDALFCFACGGICWIAAAAGSGVSWHGGLELPRFLLRFGVWFAVAFLVVLAAQGVGCGIMTAVILGCTTSGLATLLCVPQTRRLILPGAVGFTLVYAGVGWSVLALDPTAVRFWNHDAMCGSRLLCLPVEELVWSLSFGATWPVVFGYCLGDKLTWRPRRAGPGFRPPNSF
jgi:hypothetical protein